MDQIHTSASVSGFTCPSAATSATPAPAGTHTLHHRQGVAVAASVESCGRSLLAWDLHRAAGLRVRADGPAAPGATVVLGMPLGPVWVLALCRVVDLVDEEDRIGFTYATLPGHPECGVERFTIQRGEDGVTFDVLGVSRPAFWGSRLLPLVSRRVQAGVTRRYLAAADSLAAAGP